MFAFVLALLALPAPQTPPAPGTPVLAADSEARWVPFELTSHNQIRFAMTLNGQPASAVLDTGMSVSVASQSFAAASGLRPGVVTDRAEAIGGSVAIRWATARQLALGGLSRTGGRIAVADLGSLAAIGIDPIDLIVGSDVLSCCALDIDYDARRFRILPSGRLPFRGATVSLRLAPDSGAYLTQLTLGSRTLRPMLVDTGDGAAVTVARNAWAATGLRPATTTTIAYGLGGPVTNEVAIVPRLGLDSLEAREVEVRIEDSSGYSTRTGSAGRIGSGFLQRYRVLLDPQARRMVLAPGDRAAEPPLRSTSGLLVGYDKGRINVLHVMANSPAEAGGWKTGDTICAVDGARVPPGISAIGLAAWSVDAPGRVVRLGMCDGSERELTLRRFY